MDVWLYVENLGVYKSILNNDHKRIVSCNKCSCQEHILIKQIINACLY